MTEGESIEAIEAKPIEPTKSIESIEGKPIEPMKSIEAESIEPAKHACLTRGSAQADLNLILNDYLNTAT